MGKVRIVQTELSYSDQKYTLYNAIAAKPKKDNPPERTQHSFEMIVDFKSLFWGTC